MPRPAHTTAKLPRQLLAELGIADDVANKGYGGRRGPPPRKEQRKAARVEKRRHKPVTYSSRRQTSTSNAKNVESSPENQEDEQEPLPIKPERRTAQAPKAAVKQSTKFLRDSSEELKVVSRPTISRGVKDRLAADDAEIEALERALGVKSRSKLPKVFEDEGLDGLLEGLDESSDDAESRKRKRSDESGEWLEAKRRRAQGVERQNSEPIETRNDDHTDNSVSDQNDFSPGEDERSEESFSGFDDQETPIEIKTPKKRENPYIAPSVPNVESKGGKYIPPSLRKSNGSDGEDPSQLRRQIQGLLNRLSDANLVAVLADLEKLYQNHPRQHVSTALIELLCSLIFDPSALQDTFIILHAGFASAVFKTIGMDFGAQLVQQCVARFDSLYSRSTEEVSADKCLRNMIAFLSYLYSFQVVGSNLMYDFIRLFLESISENNTQLLLKVMQSTGPQLRQDDPSSLKGIVYLLQTSLTHIPPGDVSVRTRFMVETINNLKNNRMKTGLTASSIASEHIARMKKILGTLNTRVIKASEPLRIGLNDIRNTDKRGKWWLIGASYRDDERGLESTVPEVDPQRQDNGAHDRDTGFSNKLLELAKVHRMNTDIRRSIFVTIMSATDYRDAYVRLLKLRLKKAQELEIPKVLLHCAAIEETYNPYYTLIARKLCADKKLKMSFQFALWDAFKRMSGEEEDDDGEMINGKKAVGTEEIVHLAKMYGTLVADGGLTLTVLKPLNLSYLSPNAHTWLELFLITVIIQSQQDTFKKQRSELALKRIFQQSVDKERPETALELKNFLQKYVRKTDVAGGKEERKMVRWGVDLIMRGYSNSAALIDN